MIGSVAIAALVVDELIRCGMTEAVLAPGSRNAPLGYALAEADRTGRVRLHVRIDERSASFLALGLAKRSRRPVLVCCTSGTAAAHFHPAVLEASESDVPLVVVTADRPPELRGVGANQTIEQAGLYGVAVRAAVELGQVPDPAIAYVRSTVDRFVAAATGVLSGDPGPVQLNLPLREPLAPQVGEPLDVPGRPDGRPWVEPAPARSSPAPLDPAPERTLMVVGDAPPELGARARAWAEAAGWPLLAEPSSGARGGPLAVPAGPLLLGVPGVVDALLPQRVVVVGRPTLTRGVSALLRRTDLDVEVRAARWRWPDAGRQAVRVAVGLPDPPRGAAQPPGEWARRWLRLGAAAAEARDAAIADGPLGGAGLARAVASAASGGVLVVGSSLPVRDLDLAVDDLTDTAVLANRGVAGIDGTISTALGVALASPERRTVAVLGDLTFLHDSNGLLLGPGEPRPSVTLVLVDNGGGGIFATLEHGDADPATLERVFTTPVQVDFAALCAATGTAYVRVDDAAALAEALEPADGLRVVHVPLPATAADLGRRLRAAVSGAVASLLKA